MTDRGPHSHGDRNPTQRCVMLAIALVNVAFAALFARYAQADLEFIVIDWMQGGVFDRLIDVIVAVFETYLVVSAFVWTWLALRPARRHPEDARIAR
ncbi:MAG TPA: hypothetical protein VMA36_06345 [Candidatus Limnocylindria bacterium]|jgi:hypothetical protein|nr:hypothetical protein [Candidatus Limnocylindria bacterium]